MKMVLLDDATYTALLAALNAAGTPTTPGPTPPGTPPPTLYLPPGFDGPYVTEPMPWLNGHRIYSRGYGKVWRIPFTTGVPGPLGVVRFSGREYNSQRVQNRAAIVRVRDSHVVVINDNVFDEDCAIGTPRPGMPLLEAATDYVLALVHAQPGGGDLYMDLKIY
jgi:hypothetical protein